MMNIRARQTPAAAACLSAVRRLPATAHADTERSKRISRGNLLWFAGGYIASLLVFSTLARTVHVLLDLI
jgi:hypothetical protein